MFISEPLWPTKRTPLSVKCHIYIITYTPSSPRSFPSPNARISLVAARSKYIFPGLSRLGGGAVRGGRWWESCRRAKNANEDRWSDASISIASYTEVWNSHFEFWPPEWPLARECKRARTAPSPMTPSPSFYALSRRRGLVDSISIFYPRVERGARRAAPRKPPIPVHIVHFHPCGCSSIIRNT